MGERVAAQVFSYARRQALILARVRLREHGLFVGVSKMVRSLRFGNTSRTIRKFRIAALLPTTIPSKSSERLLAAQLAKLGHNRIEA